MSKDFLTEIEKDFLGKNLQAIILCDIIQDRLFLNYLQRIIIEKTLNYTIVNTRYQYQDRSDQFLLYVRGKGGVGKSRIVKAIHLEFSFLKRRPKVLIAVLTGVISANIRGATIHEALTIHECM